MQYSQAISFVRKIKTRNILPNPDDLITYADGFLKERINALNKDVIHCLHKPYAPFPAILTCFSTIDLLGALYKGESEKRSKAAKKGKKTKPRPPPTGANSRRYMKRFMHYKSENIRLLQEIFRHKTVHLAQPKPAIYDKNRMIAWRYYHYRSSKHLVLQRISPISKLKIKTPYDIYCNYGFSISITRLKNDIKDSVFRKPDGYLEMLKGDHNLQMLFRRAMYGIYNPFIIQ